MTSTVGVRLLVVAAALLGFCSVALPAMACSMIAPVELDQLVGGSSWVGPIDGVFQYQHIAWTPNLGYRDARSVSIVTRYWGLAPSPIGFDIHGDHYFLFASSCPNGAGSLGAAQYGVVEAGQRSSRPAWLIAAFGDLNATQAALLEDRFGPPVEVPVPLIARAAAWSLVLWVPALLVGLPVAGIAWRIRRTSRKVPTNVSPSHNDTTRP